MAGGNKAFRICSSVSEALSYMPSPLQYTEPNTKNDLWVFWSQHNNEFPTVFPSAAATTIYHDTIKEKIASALKNAYIPDNYRCWLVQFWAPVATKDQIFLTTCDLPFGLTKLLEGLCYYRSECLKFRIPIVTENENQLGPTGRVFKHGLPEMSPDISRYSAADFPQHSSAFTSGLGNYLAVPVFEPLSNECTGVLEIIGDKKGSFSQDLVQMVYEMLKKVELRSSNMYGHPEKKGLRGLERALKEIEDQLNFLCRTHQLPLAQTWLPILDGSNVERFTTAEEQFCICTSAGYEFRAACDMFHLGKSQGVVGRAFLSHSSCFCSDITELRMSEYPLAHVAHRVGLHSSFAICLQSSYTGDYVYLLEFFLPQDNKSDCRSAQTMLNMLLASMKRQFRSFKLASGQKLGEKLSVEIIPVPSDDGLNSFEICHSVKPLFDIEAVARPRKIEWFDPLNRLLKSGNTVNICPENIDLTTSSRTANTTTKLTNVRVLTNRVFSNSFEEESMMKISEGHHRIKSVMLQQSVDAKVNGTETTLASQSAPNSLGTKHFEINDMNCSSDQLESAKVADRHCEESSGGDQLCHDTTTSLTHADELEFLLSGVHGDELERFAKVSMLYDREELQAVNLRTSEVSTTQNAKVCDLSYQAALPEILEVLKSACETHGLPLAQTWVPCVQQGKGGCRHSEENLIHCVSTEDSACYVADPHVRGFHEACSEHHLLKGQGVVGIAFMTNQPCFSADLTSYSKTEYPLSHHAQMFGLQAAVAIRLRSISTGSCDFVLEFFLPSDCRNPEEHRKMLTSLSIIIPNVCRTLRVKELQEEVVSIGEAANPSFIRSNKEQIETSQDFG